MDGGHGEVTGEPDRWAVLAIGAAVGDLTPAGLARYAAVPRAQAGEVLGWASDEGLLVDGGLDPEASAELTGRVPPERVEQARAAAALWLMRTDPQRAGEALDHARAAPSVDQSELVELLAVTGRLALASGDHDTAELLLAGAVELSASAGHDPVGRARLLHDLAQAADARGRISEARSMWLEVIRLAAASGEHDLVVDAAVRSVFPVDWRAGDRQAAALLGLAESVHGSGPRAGAILAARAMVEMRVPSSEEQGHQIAWVTRPSVAQPLAERALTLTQGGADGDRLVALVAWRQTHRGPQHLEGRLAASTEALDLAQRLLDHDRLADAAATAVVDHLEVGARAQADEALAVLRWVASISDNPRLGWRATTMSAAAALLDGDVETAVRLRAEAVAIGERHDLPGWLSGEILLSAATVVTADDLDGMRVYLVPLQHPAATSPVARSVVAWSLTRLGEIELALQHARLACRTVDPESSAVLCLSLLARVAAATGAPDLVGHCEEQLTRWSGRMVVDGVGWWCHGPVDLALAELAAADGRLEQGRSRLAAAEALVARTGDMASRARVEVLAERLATVPTTSWRRGPVPGLDQLTAREREVLTLMARGCTNAEIAARLAYSASTIRVDTMAIYRKLGVAGRVQAVAAAAAAGLVER